MLRPCSGSTSVPPGSNCGSTSMRDDVVGCVQVLEPELADLCQHAPLSGMPVGRTQSKALIRSVLTISSWSPRSYIHGLCRSEPAGPQCDVFSIASLIELLPPGQANPVHPDAIHNHTISCTSPLGLMPRFAPEFVIQPWRV